MKELNNASLPLDFAGGKYSTESVRLPNGQYIIKIVATGPCIGKVLKGNEVLTEVDFSSYKLLSYNDLKISFILSSESEISLEVTPKRGDIKVYSASLSSSILPVGVDEYPTPTGTINITENGENINVKQYAKANVNVPQPSGNINITENGEGIDIAQYATANVNVEEPLKVTYLKANDINYVPGDRCKVIPTNGELRVTFYFNRSISQSTVHKANFIIISNDSGNPIDYTLAYPTSNSISVKFPFASKSADPNDQGYDVMFNDEFLISLVGDLLITPIAIAYDPANTLDAPDYHYRITDTMSYGVPSIDQNFYMAFIVDSRWANNLRDGVSSVYTLENSSVEIPCDIATIGREDSAVVLVFPTSDMNSGTYDVKYRGETCFSITIQII